MSGGRQSGEHRKRAAGIARRAARVFPVILLRTGLLRLGAALLVAAAVLLFATTAMGQTVPPVNFNNVPGIPLGFTPGLVAIGDVTGHGNGITDVVMIGTPSGGGITVLPGNGDGTFGTPITSATTTQVTGASGIALADLNGDGAIDVVVLTPQGGLPPSVTIFLNNPASKGSFSAGTSYQIFSLYGGLAGPVYLADINGDGHPDIVLPNVGGTSFVVLLNNGDGTFTASNAQVIQIGGELVALAVGNFTGGTMPDVAVANYNRIVTVWKNTTAARSTTVSFAAQTPAALPAGTDGFYSIAAADFSGNGFTDIAAAVSADNAVYVLDGAGNGTLTYNSAQTVANVPMAYGAQSLTGDFNGDGKPDLALRSGNDGFLVLLNAGGKLQMNLNSSFVVGYGFGYSTSGFAAGALNGNGLTDILGATNNSLSVFFATGNSLTPFGGTLSYPAGSSPIGIAPFDFGGCQNGLNSDLAVINPAGTTLSLLLHDATIAGALDAPVMFDFTPAAPVAVTAGYLTSSASTTTGCFVSFVAVATYNSSTGDTTVQLVGKGPATQGPILGPSFVIAGQHVLSMTSGDFNGDGRTDLAVAWNNGTNGTVQVFTGDGVGNFTASTPTFTVDLNPAVLAAADFNIDGMLDLAVLNTNVTGTTSEVSVLLNNTVLTGGIVTPTFAAPYVVSVPNGSCGNCSMTGGNFDGKGQELAILTDQILTILLNSGSGILSAETQVFADSVPGSSVFGGGGGMVAGDFNSDGKLDLAIGSGSTDVVAGACTVNDTVIVLTGNGNGTFNRPTNCGTNLLTGVNFNAGNFPNLLAVGNFNEDGLPNIAVTDTLGNAVTLLLRAAPGITFAPLSLNFGTVPVSTPSTLPVKITNTGAANLLFGITPFSTTTPLSDPFTVNASACPASPSGSPAGLTNSLASGQSCTVNATFTPAAGGANSGGLTFLDNAPSGTPSAQNPGLFTHTYSLLGAGLAPSSLAVTLPSSPTLGALGSALVYTVNLANTSSSSLTNVTAAFTFNTAVTFGSLTGLTPACSATSPVTTFQCNIGTLGPQASATLTLTVTPLTAGQLTLTVSGSDTQGDTSQSSATTTVSSSAPITLTDTEVIHVTDSLSLPDVFDNEMITVHDAVTITPLISVIAPVVSFSPSTVGFGSVAAGTAGTQVIAVSNIGEGQSGLVLASAAITPSPSAFTIGSISCSNDANSFPTTLPSGGACQVTITYQAPSPIPTPAPTATLAFTDNAALSNLASTASGSNFTQAILLNGSGSSSTSPQPSANVSVADNETITTTDTPGVKTVMTSATALVSSLNPSGGGQPVTFTATVTSVPAGGGTPTGPVTFYDGLTPLGTGRVLLNSSGVASLTTSALIAGSHSITAIYGGDPNFAASESNILTQGVLGHFSLTTLSSSLNPSVAGQTITFTATVASVPSGPNTPTGTVTFSDSSANPLATATMSLTAGVATLTTSLLALGSHSITGTYNGDTVDVGGSSSPLTQIVVGFMPLQTNPSVAAGKTVTISLALVNPTGSGLTFSNFTCTSTTGGPLPIGTACSGFAPVSMSSGTPQAGTTLSFIYATTGKGTMTPRSPAHPSNRRPLPQWMLGYFAALIAMAAMDMMLRSRNLQWRSIFFLWLVVTAAIALAGCSPSAIQVPPTAPGNYTFIVMGSAPGSGSSGVTTISTQVTVTVQ